MFLETNTWTRDIRLDSGAVKYAPDTYDLQNDEFTWTKHLHKIRKLLLIMLCCKILLSSCAAMRQTQPLTCFTRSVRGFGVQAFEFEACDMGQSLHRLHHTKQGKDSSQSLLALQ